MKGITQKNIVKRKEIITINNHDCMDAGGRVTPGRTHGCGRQSRVGNVDRAITEDTNEFFDFI